MKKEKFYVVTMYRWGERGRHSYVLGLFDKKHAAKKAAESEQEYRGGNKYFPEILEYDINKPNTKKEIVSV